MIRHAALALALTLAAAAAAQPIEAGRQYRELSPARPTSAKPGQVEVIEFFSIGCPHCAEFEPYLQSWLKRKPANVKFVRVPATFNPFFKLLARASYALEDVKAAERATPLLFDAIHVKRDPSLLRPLGEYNAATGANDPARTAAAEAAALDALTQFVAANAGVDAKKFRAAWNSFSMNTRLAQADAMFRNYDIRGVPAVAIAGQYVTGPDPRRLQIRDFEEVIRVTDHLIGVATKAAKK